MCENNIDTILWTFLNTVTLIFYFSFHKSPQLHVANNFYHKTEPSRRLSGLFIVNFEHISHLVLVFLLLTSSRWMSAGSNFLDSTEGTPILFTRWKWNKCFDRCKFSTLKIIPRLDIFKTRKVEQNQLWANKKDFLGHHFWNIYK